jgi:DNA-binding NtrC family response regulator
MWTSAEARLKAVTPESLARLERYSWPGNIRELQNVLERACVLSPGPVVEILDELRPAGAGEPASAGAGGRVYAPDGAGALLGVNPSTLRSRMKKLGITKQCA